MSSWQVGAVRVDRVLEFEQPLLDPLQLYPAATAQTLDRHRPWLEPRLLDPSSGLMVLAIQSYLIRSRGITILVDTCGGNDKPRPNKRRYHMNRHPFLERLAACGVTPEAVDYVLCTHLHVDHVGWNTRLVDGRWVPTFPRARHVFATDEWNYWHDLNNAGKLTDNGYYVDSVLPVAEAGLVTLVGGSHEITDEVVLEPTPGHTPGHVAVHIRSQGRDAVLSGDLMHTALQCAEPDWSSCFCSDPALSARTRRSFLERYAESATLILPAHFPTPSAGAIRRHGDAWRFRFEGE